MNRLARIMALSATAASAFLLCLRVEMEKPLLSRTFRIVDPASPTFTQAEDRSDFLPSIGDASSVHAPSLVETSDRILFCLWWGGSREGAKDVRLFLSQKSSPTAEWSEPRAIMSGEQAARELFRPIRRIGNAVIYTTGPRELRVVFVTTTIGGWSTASLNYIKSSDNGSTWSRARRIHISPVLNISELVRSQPVQLSDGSHLLPIYHELIGKFPELLWIREHGPNRLDIRKTKAFGGRKAFQPALAPLTETIALMALRDPNGSHLFTTYTTDAAQSFSLPSRSGLPNPDAAIDAITLPGIRVLLAHNNTDAGRHNLTLSISKDDGVTWRRARVIEEEPGAEFSYPALHCGPSGQIHLAYTWKRQRIRYHSVNPAWLEQ